MRKLYTFIILLFIGSLQMLSAEEINFQKGSWDEVKAMAAKSGKYIFLDAYTDWCGWCKVLDKETFTDKAVIDFVNANFIPVKYEMETGIGKTLAMKYRVRGFPTQLFFSPEGKLVYTGVGFAKPEQFIQTLKNAVNPEKQVNYKGITDDLNPPFPDFYKSAFEKNGSPGKKLPTDSVVYAYLNQQTDLYSEVNWSVMSRFRTTYEYNDFFLENIRKYEELYGESEINNKLYSIIEEKLEKAIEFTNEDMMIDALNLTKLYDPKGSKESIDYMESVYYEKTNNWGKYTKIIDQRIENNKLQPESINESAWRIYQNADDKNAIKKAISWMKNIIEKETNWEWLDTYASLLYKNNELKQAKKYAQMAIDEGKKKNANVEETEKLLEKINTELK